MDFAMLKLIRISTGFVQIICKQINKIKKFIGIETKIQIFVQIVQKDKNWGKIHTEGYIVALDCLIYTHTER